MIDPKDVDLNSPLLIMFEGEPQYYLNNRLAAAKGIIDFKDDDCTVIDYIDVQRLEELKELHVQKLVLFKAMRETDDVEQLKAYASAFEAIEFAMQQAWGFEMDRNMHEWYLVPKCTCPKMDNRDNRGTQYRVISGGCPIHGGALHVE